MTDDLARRFGRQLARLEKAQRDKGSTPQIGTSSIEDGTLLEYDINGQLKQAIGKQADGTNTTVQFNGPTPPEPSTPEVTLLTEAAQIHWDGTWADGAVAPLDLARIDVHIVPDILTDPMTVASAATISAAGWGDATLNLAPGDYYAVLVAWTTSGMHALSAHSAPFTVDELVLPATSDGVPPTAAPSVQLIPAAGLVYVKLTPPENPDPILGYSVYVNGEFSQYALQTVVAVGFDADGTKLPYTSDTSFWVTAHDADGEGPASATSVARPVRLEDSDLAQEILDELAANGQAADDAQEAASQAVADALEAANKADAAQITANAAETPTGAQNKADTAASTAYTLAVDAAAADATAKSAATWTAATEAAAADATTKANAAQTAAGGYTDTQVATKGKVIAQVSKPTGANRNANNIWIDITATGTPPVAKNTPHRWSAADNDWVPITDRVAVEAAAAALAAQQTADAANTAATTAITTANGKNANSFSTASTPPVVTGRVEGDVHSQLSGTTAIKQWVLTSGAWVERKLDGATLTNLDATTITTGFLNVALLIQAGAIDADQIDVASLRAPLATIGLLTTDEIYTREGIFIGGTGGSSIRISQAEGYRQTDSAGIERLVFPIDPSSEAPFKFDGDVIARGLTVKGNSAFEGTNNEISRNSSVRLAKGTTSPTSAPSASTPSWASAAPLAPLPVQAQGVSRDGTDWIFADLPVGGFATKPRIGRMTASGAITWSTLTGMPTPTSTQNRYLHARDILKLGSSYYLLAGRTTGPSNFGEPAETRVYKLNATTLALEASWFIGNGGNILGYGDDSRLATDGTSIYTAGGPRPSPEQNRSRGEVRRWNTSGTLQSTAVMDAPVGYGNFVVGNFDFGSLRYIFAQDTWLSPNYVTFNSSGVSQPSETFRPPDVSIQNATIGWDGSAFVLWRTESGYENNQYVEAYPRVPVRSSTRLSTLTLRAAATWYSTTSGSETLRGPIATVTIPARAGAVTFTMAAPQYDGTESSPNASRLYVGLTDSTLRLQGSFVQTLTVADPNTSSGALPPATNTFPDGVAARLESAAGSTYIDGAGKIRALDFGAGPANQIAIDALGNGRVGPMQFTTTFSGYGSTTGHMGGTILGQLADAVSATDAVNKRTMEAADAAVVAYVDGKTARQSLAIQPSAALALTSTTWTQVPSALATLSVTSTSDVFLVLGSVDFDQSAANAFIARAIVGIDGTAAAPADMSAQALARHTVDAGMRVTAPLFWILSNLTVGNHTLRLLGSLASGTAGWTIGTQSRVQVVQVA